MTLNKEYEVGYLYGNSILVQAMHSSLKIDYSSDGSSEACTGSLLTVSAYRASTLRNCMKNSDLK